MVDETDAERKAMEWLDSLASGGGWGAPIYDHARTLKRMLARAVLPETLSDELVEAIWWASGAAQGRISTHRQQAEAIVDAIRDHLTAPKTKDGDQVERVARAMVRALGRNPDEVVPETGYADARPVPRWYKEIEWAKRSIAASEALAMEKQPGTA
jgi:hypothetical protein